MIAESPRLNAPVAGETPTEPSADGAARSVPSLSVHAITDVAALAEIVTEWDALVKSALEPSPSSEPWMLIPALSYLASGSSVTVLTMRLPTSPQAGSGELCAVFPLEIRSRHRGVPIRTIRLWDHIYSLNPTPLLHRDYAEGCVRALFRWVREAYSPRTLIEFPALPTNSAFAGVLAKILHELDGTYLATDMYCRAFYRRDPAAARTTGAAGSRHRRTRRLEKRLAETGNLTYEILEPRASTTTWVNEFVALEMKGWKGREGTAFGCNDRHRAFLTEIVSAAQERGHLLASALRVDGRAIAMKLSFLCKPGGYLFKTTYDEEFARYTPGTLLEIENTRLIEEVADLLWMDSLAAPNHAMIERLWRDRVTVLTLLASPGSWVSDFLISMLPMARAVRRRLQLKRRAAP